MVIAGLQKMTMLDYPEKLAALVFTQGCNFACSYCHNPEMIPRLKVLNDPELEEATVLDFLQSRVGLLDGVVVSGGEPTLHEDLPEFIKKIKKMGFLVKLDTNGSNPQILKHLLRKNLLDYIAMDIKHCAGKYSKLTKYKYLENIKESIKIIKDSDVDYEFRSTILPYFHDEADLREMGEMIKGADKWYLQNFRSLKTFDKKLQKEDCFSNAELERLKKIAREYAKYVDLRI